MSWVHDPYIRCRCYNITSTRSEHVPWEGLLTKSKGLLINKIGVNYRWPLLSFVALLLME